MARITSILTRQTVVFQSAIRIAVQSGLFFIFQIYLCVECSHKLIKDMLEWYIFKLGISEQARLKRAEKNVLFYAAQIKILGDTGL